MKLKGAWLRNSYNLCSTDGSSLKEKLRVNIPFYQRPFKWEKDHINKLITDFLEHTKEKPNKDEEKYFAGSIVTVEKENNEYHDIIDGQQRITTVYLLNYLRFLILRGYIEKSISSGKLPRVSRAANNLKESYINMVGKGRNCDFNALEDHLYSEIKKFEEIDVTKPDYEDELNKFLYDYQQKIKLPEKKLKDEVEYKKEFHEKLKELLNNEELALRYSRLSLNNKLKESLTKVYIEVSEDRDLKVETIGEDGKNNSSNDSIVEKYTTSITDIYESLKEWLDENNSYFKGASFLDRAEEIINIINDFLEKVEFCLIRTGNEDDAYTLFEVLNDRALEIDDLDLVKNHFYKEYCNKGSVPDNDNELDKQIETLDNIWGDEVFSQDMRDKHSKLTAYLTTVFLTGYVDLDPNDKQRYRDRISEGYLDDLYFKPKKEYRYVNIKNDFRMFQAIKKMIVDSFDLPIQKSKRKKESLESENRNDRSITYKAMHLLNALDLDGVKPALINIILKKYIDNYANKGNDEIKIDQFIDYINRLINDKNHEEDEFIDIHNCAKNLWVLSLLAKDYKKPREYAKTIIEKNNFKDYDRYRIDIKSDLLKNSEKEFLSWTDKWRYGSKQIDDFKIKLLFMKLFQTIKDDEKLKFTAFKYSCPVNELELEHIEARNYNAEYEFMYFEPKEPNVERKDYVNALGNFMIIDKENNKIKSDSPANSATEYYKDMGIAKNHWIAEELDNLLKQEGEGKNITGECVKIPKESFFDERKKRLINYFFSILKNSSLTSSEIEIYNVF